MQNDCTTMVNEEWRPVVGYEDVYEVSSQGRVRSLDRVIKRRTQSGVSLLQVGQKILKLKRSGKYRAVNLAKYGKVETVTVHRLVAASFIGPCPNGYCVHHLNENKNDNRLDNLVYMSALKHMRLHTQWGRGGNAKLNVDDVRMIRALLKKGMSYRQVAARFDISKSMVGEINNGHFWAYVE